MFPQTVSKSWKVALLSAERVGGEILFYLGKTIQVRISLAEVVIISTSQPIF
jgi:hypothetical protein